MKAFGLAFLALASAAVGAAIATYAIKKQNDIDLYDFEFDEDEDFSDDDFLPEDITVSTATSPIDDNISDLSKIDGDYPDEEA
ncbi:MAG: hypothetical protein LBM59_00790 [Ruminococcus sp.]|jgi:hypothetical protein|nr:hypothetical protein [Ruminococcus sp.]